MKLTDIRKDDDTLQHYIDMMDNRWKELSEHELESISKLLQFLFLTNAGGAVAVLSFIGTASLDILNWKVLLSLTSFSTGVVLVGILHFLRHLYFSKLFTSWRINTGKFMQNQLSWGELADSDRSISSRDNHLYIVGFICGGCLVVGFISGLMSLLTV
jgi:hypothetical protein